MRRSTPYSAFMRYWNTSNCSVPTTPTMTSSMPEFGTLKIWMAPSCAICSTPFQELLALHGVLGADAGRKCSGAKVGMPPNRNFLPGTVMVSPMEKNAGVEDADDVPRVGLVYDLPFGGHKLLAAATGAFFAALDMIIFCVALELAGADTHEGQTVAVGLVHVCLNFEHERGKSGLNVSITPQSASRGRGLGVMRRNSSRNGSTPKLVRAEPKNTGDRRPARTIVEVKLRTGPRRAAHIVDQLLMAALADELRDLRVVQINFHLAARFLPDTPEKKISWLERRSYTP